MVSVEQQCNSKTSSTRRGFLFPEVFIEKEIKMAKTIRLTENDLVRLVKRVIEEQGIGGTNDKAQADIFKKFPQNSNQPSTNCLGQFKKIPKGSKTRFGTLSEHDFWTGKYENYSISINYDGTCNLVNVQQREKFSAKWKCENGKFIVYDKKQRAFTFD